METSDLARVRRFCISRRAIEETIDTLRVFGAREFEGLVLWLGSIDGEQASVLHVLTPPQDSISSEEGLGYFVGGDTLFQINKALSEKGLRLIAQVHSHPRDAYHSRADDRYAIVTADGGLSLVVPNFGDAPLDPTQWAAYRLREKEWQRLSVTEARELFVVADDEI